VKLLSFPNSAAVLVATVLALYASAAPVAQLAWPGASARAVPGEVLLKFKPSMGVQQRAAAAQAWGHTVLAHLEPSGWTRVKLAAGQSVAQGLAVYQNDPQVEHAQPNYIYRGADVPNDPSYGQLWAFRNIGQTIASADFAPANGIAGDDMNIEPAWGHITDCSSVVVAVVDSGVNYDQEDLAPNMWNGGPSFPNHGFDFVDNDNDPMDLAGHGSHVAGIIGAAGNNAKGGTGVCWSASIMAVRALDAAGAGTTATIVSGIDFAVTHGARVINLSLGGGSFDQLMSDSIGNAQANDVVVVVAAGNDGVDNDAAGNGQFPCNLTQPNLVCVAALDQRYALASFSNWGATSVDVGAPGTNILSTYPGSKTKIADHFNTSGTLSWTTSGGGWAYAALPLGGSIVDTLIDPASFPSGTYLNSADNRVYKTFNLSGANAAVLQFAAQVSIMTGDALNVNYSASGGDPFVGGVQLIGGSGSTGGVLPFSFDLAGCTGATCSVGFQLKSNASGASQGAGILDFGISTLQLGTSSYRVVSGTSMATPEVAGLAAMLRAFNPRYTYADTVNAINNAGRAVAALSGKTTTGRAVDAMASLAYINPPTGLSAAVQ